MSINYLVLNNFKDGKGLKDNLLQNENKKTEKQFHGIGFSQSKPKSLSNIT